MAICPFFEESMWNGNKCKASGGKMGHRYRNGMQIIAELIYYHQIITNVRCIRMRQEKAIVAVDAI